MGVRFKRRRDDADQDIEETFLGVLSSSLDDDALPETFATAQRRFTALLGDYQAHRLSAEQFATELSQLVVRHDDGSEWTLGATSGSWYRRGADGAWVADVAPDTLLPPEADASWILQAPVPTTAPEPARPVAWVEDPAAETPVGDAPAAPWSGVLVWDEDEDYLEPSPPPTSQPLPGSPRAPLVTAADVADELAPAPAEHAAPVAPRGPDAADDDWGGLLGPTTSERDTAGPPTPAGPLEAAGPPGTAVLPDAGGYDETTGAPGQAYEPEHEPGHEPDHDTVALAPPEPSSALAAPAWLPEPAELPPLLGHPTPAPPADFDELVPEALWDDQAP